MSEDFGIVEVDGGEIKSQNAGGTVINPATEGKQDTANNSLSSINTKVATSARQDTGNASLGSIDGKVSTEAKQDTGNTSLGNLDTKTGEVQASPTTNTILGRLKDIFGAFLTGIRIRDATGSVLVKISVSGEMHTTTAIEAPPGATPFELVARSDMSGQADSFQSVAVGETLVVQRLSGSAGASVEGSTVELFHDAAGDLSNLVFIDDVVMSGGSESTVLTHMITGSATMRLVMRRRRLDGGAKPIKGRVEGYIET